jgi:preprotein translocase subunit SecE
MFRRIFSQENVLAVLICLAVIAILIMTADQAPQWIYQGF